MDLNELDSLLDTALDGTLLTEELAVELAEPVEQELIEVVNLDEGEIDPRLKLLSHSSRTTLHKCPRKYQLYRLNATEVDAPEEQARRQAVTFAYGTALGVGIQSLLEGKTKDQAILDLFLAWGTDLEYSNADQKKSVWLCIHALNSFAARVVDKALGDFELVTYKGRSAVELSFQIELPNGYFYRGYVDAVLRHKHTGEVIVLELKTSSGTANPAMFKNSGQAIGYSVVLDLLFPELSSYTVIYAIYETKSMDYKILPFKKTLLQRALWLQELLIDTELVTLYSQADTYPTHGEACFDFFKECEYMSLCHMTTTNLTKPLTTKVLAMLAKARDSYQFRITFADLVELQIAKGDYENTNLIEGDTL